MVLILYEVQYIYKNSGSLVSLRNSTYSHIHRVISVKNDLLEKRRKKRASSSSQINLELILLSSAIFTKKAPAARNISCKANESFQVQTADQNVSICGFFGSEGHSKYIFRLCPMIFTLPVDLRMNGFGTFETGLS